MEVTTVWILYLGNVGDVQGIFSSEEKAQDHLLQKHLYYLERGEWSIVPYELDEGW